MIKKIRYIFLAALVIIFCNSCGNREVIKRMQEFEEGVHNPTSVEELETAIKKYQRRVNDIMIAQERIGIWYKMLASRYMDRKMYAKALEVLEQAVTYYPENQTLFFSIGVCAANMAKRSLNFSAGSINTQKNHYNDLAVSAYKRAIEIDPKYINALYGLSVLYVFELDQNEKAIPLLERILEVEKKPFDVLFVLGRAYYATGKNDQAIQCYDKIISLSASEEQRMEAEKNKRLIEGTMQ
ncbi:tetratricopeptide repeat protein [Treponema phagedenis]|uniref:Tetratricopeptide repeat protein n=1 Tax=Treponema phagedenis TaxID=162 RepID=A0A0B7GV15_TREPH|nr:tetratricopeptide repeat protein [Treponema phagedenis]NVP24556.1 tetratricopeptide repeat protein [Treponema phagedenis]QEJ94746.1 tetratricopeptide repeat protein [Treponema phagedenis]QEJ97683.1 tetratricopeptide repeat protein [Treponema phagedenis]QEK00652.1 tetratricopeptide repeat protein [Treponema phagedenis]QEK03251.1 tetratricopeptide repeat protein [Treponema phagedenis]